MEYLKGVTLLDSAIPTTNLIGISKRKIIKVLLGDFSF